MSKTQEQSIFEPRTQLKPYEYPNLLEYKQAIRDAYWEHGEFTFEGDVQDFRVNASETEQDIIRKTMLAIAQIEVKVKSFWGDIHRQLPKPEVASVGATFSESEVRHLDAYSELLDILGLQEQFEQLSTVPAIQSRIEYLDDCITNVDTASRGEFARSVLLFSTFVEHVSLFSQFLIMMSFDKYRKKFTGIANVVEATSKEEQLHGLCGQEIVNTIKSENPNIFDDGFDAEITAACQKAYEAEMDILDWIFSDGELSFLPRDVIDAFVKDRFNTSLDAVDVEPIFTVDEELVAETEWFDDEIKTTKDNDFFSKQETAYSRNNEVSADNLF